jgi:DNA polymerase lambda
MVRERATTLGLNADQIIGLRYFEEFKQRMFRVEASEIIEVVRAAVRRLFGTGLRMEPCGSYRRNALTCGDVDILFTYDQQQEADSQELGSESEVLSRIVSELGSFLTDHLKNAGNTRPEQRHSASATYFGVCQLSPGKPHRRIDLKVYPTSEWPFALLSFTGSGHFNRSMRLYARRAGYSLSDHDIRPARHARGRGRGARIWTGPPIHGIIFREEKDIFDFLGLAYREPQSRELDATWIAETVVSVSDAMVPRSQHLHEAIRTASAASYEGDNGSEAFTEVDEISQEGSAANVEVIHSDSNPEA